MATDPAPPSPRQPQLPAPNVWARLGRRRAVALAAAVAVVVLTSLWTPAVLRAALHAVGYAVCHQIADHSFFVGGWQLPLCARCTGTFLGATLSLALLWWRGRLRAGNLPPAHVLAALTLFIFAWAFDGLNSYLSSILGIFTLYPPHNLLRLVTGLGNGIALTHLAMPVFALTVWAQPAADRSLRGAPELAVTLAVAAAAGCLVAWAPRALFGPLALGSALGAVALLTVVNTVIVVVVAGREAKAAAWRDLLLPLAAGLLLTAAEIGGINLARGWLSLRLGLPI
ncbi:MAG: DUF2085 domain-containing protein [Chloroflexi bacterium]|nr:DUF2085 domain-containing protein [Chloroflexota bacterium]